MIKNSKYKTEANFVNEKSLNKTWIKANETIEFKAYRNDKLKNNFIESYLGKDAFE